MRIPSLRLYGCVEPKALRRRGGEGPWLLTIASRPSLLLLFFATIDRWTEGFAYRHV